MVDGWLSVDCFLSEKGFVGDLFAQHAAMNPL